MPEREDPREFRPVRESSVWTAVILVVVLLGAGALWWRWSQTQAPGEPVAVNTPPPAAPAAPADVPPPPQQPEQVAPLNPIDTPPDAGGTDSTSGPWQPIGPVPPGSRAPKLERGGVPKPPKPPRRRRPTLGRLRPGEIPGIRADRRPYVTIALVPAPYPSSGTIVYCSDSVWPAATKSKAWPLELNCHVNWP